MKAMPTIYRAIFTENPREDGRGYTVEIAELPGCLTEGDTYEEALSNIKEATRAYLESLEKDGESVPEDFQILPILTPVTV